MIRCAVFDLDDVILPTPPIFGTLAREHGIRANPFRRFLRGDYRETLTGKHDLLEVLPSHLKRWAWEGTPESFVQAWFESSTQCDAQAVSIVRTLRNADIPCALASNQDPRRGAFLESLPELTELFPRRHYSHTLGVAKPSPSFFHRVAHSLCEDPNHLLLLDDAARNVKTARSCGWQAEACATPAALRAAVVRHFPELSFPELGAPS